MITHPIAPIFDGNSKILILGSFPYVKSREQMFFYGHPKNRFWQVLSEVFEDKTPVTVKEKRAFLLKHGVAVWDVIASCDIIGSSDSSIRNVKPNDIEIILSAADIKAIFVNGKTAEKYYNKYLKEKVHREAILLPSTSPANAKLTLEDLANLWEKKIIIYK